MLEKEITQLRQGEPALLLIYPAIVFANVRDQVFQYKIIHDPVYRSIMKRKIIAICFAFIVYAPDKKAAQGRNSMVFSAIRFNSMFR